MLGWVKLVWLFQLLMSPDFYISSFGFLLLWSRSDSLSKVTRCFSLGVLCSFLCPPDAHERKEQSANLPTALLRLFFLNGYSSRPYFGGRRESPIYFIIGQSAVNTATHNQSTILQDFLPCVFLALRNHIEYSFKDVLCPNSVKFLLHNLKIQPLIIYIPLALHWIFCGV